VARNSDKASAEKAAPGTENAANAAMPLAEQLVLALCEAAGTPFEALARLEGEHESDYLPRVLPGVAVAFKAKLDDLVQTADAMLKVQDNQLISLREELKAVNRRLASQRGATTKAKSRIVELEEAGKPRKFGPMSAVFDDPAEAFDAVDLMTAIDAADELVLAFSDGVNELKGVKPREVQAEAFRLTRGRVHFMDGPLEVTGPGDADTVTTLAGVALLVDGEQLAWSPMAQPLNIGAGQTLNLAGSVIF